MNSLADPRVQTLTYYGHEFPVITEVVHNLWVGGWKKGLMLPKEIVHVVRLTHQTYPRTHDLKSELYVPMADSDDQPLEMIQPLKAWVQKCFYDEPLLVHCRTGLNRAALVAAAALSYGYPSDVAVALLRQKRSPHCLSNRHFERYLLGASALGV